MFDQYLVKAKLINKEEEVIGYPVFCTGQINAGKVYVCQDVTSVSSWAGMIAIGDFVQVDPETIQRNSKTVDQSTRYDNAYSTFFYECPHCGVSDIVKANRYCRCCGGKLDWSE